MLRIADVKTELCISRASILISLAGNPDANSQLITALFGRVDGGIDPLNDDGTIGPAANPWTKMLSRTTTTDQQILHYEEQNRKEIISSHLHYNASFNNNASQPASQTAFSHEQDVHVHPDGVFQTLVCAPGHACHMYIYIYIL